MSEHNLEQSLSALMDGEATELELQRVLRHLDDPQIRQAWQRMHHVRSAMHREPLVALDVSVAVREALDGVEMDKAVAPVRASGWKSWQRMAVAASVTLAVLGGVRFYNQAQLQDAEPALAQSAAPAVQQQRAPAYLRERPVVLASYGGQASEEEQQEEARDSSWQREHLPLYLKQHARQSGTGGSKSALPYARAASMEGR